MLLSSGFQATKSTPTPSSVTTPTVLRIAYGLTGEALVTAKAEPYAKAYEVQAAEVGEDGALGPYGPSVLQSSSRKIPVQGLTPGKVYVFRVRVIGSKGEVSNWSAPMGQRML